MRLLIHVWACLAFAGISSAYATETLTKEGDNKTVINKEEKAVMTAVEVIPDMTLRVAMDSSGCNLNVDLSGNNEELTWIIFQPKGRVISRLTTTSKINEIRINNLEKGHYVLMVKDQNGRMLFQTFDKV